MVSIVGFSISKDMKSPDTNEDAFAWSQLDNNELRVAVADGASADIYSGLWATCLVDNFISSGTLNLISASNHWQTAVSSKPKTWFMEDKMRHGSHAAFIGVTISTTNQVSISSAGDICIFQIRKSELINSFPIHNAEDFGVYPNLISTQNISTSMISHELIFQPEDILLLATDALAHWILSERLWFPWQSLVYLEKTVDFERFMQSLRDSKRLTVDDTTLVIIRK